MKILFCSTLKPSKSLGASKVLIELIEELEELGCTCNLITPIDVCREIEKYTGVQFESLYHESLRNYLQQHAFDYDIVEYDHHQLPYPRSEFSKKTLFVARSVLLAHHFGNIKYPIVRSLKNKIGDLLYKNLREAQNQTRIKNATLTIKEADIVNVSNSYDKSELVKQGIDAKKIVVIPYGISRSRRPLFDAVSSAPHEQPMVGFVGTFDWRKGAADFPSILQNIVSAVPDTKFRLMGTASLRIFATEDKILAYFPKNLRKKIEVIPRFQPEELPQLLAPCSVGVFPSYIEGFGFAVLEMLAASVPVIAYDAPGPPMMLPPQYLVQPGDTQRMSEKVISLLSDKAELAAARQWAKQQSQQFCWQQIAKQTREIYLEAWKINQENIII